MASTHNPQPATPRQDSLFDAVSTPPIAIPGAAGKVRFNGPEYVPERDQKRLSGQILRIFNLMRDGKWRSLPEIAQLTGDPEASISAQLRHLRKPRFGSHTVNRRHVSNGLFEYSLEVRIA